MTQIPILFILIELLIYCDSRPPRTANIPLIINGNSNQISDDDGVIVVVKGSRGENPRPSSSSVDFDNYFIINGNGLSKSTTTASTKQRRDLHNSAGPDFKSLVHGLENTDENIESNGVIENLSIGTHQPSSTTLNEIARLTDLVGTSLNALETAATLASNSTVYLQDMLSTIQNNSQALINQLDHLRNLSVVLGQEIDKPLKKVEAFIEQQLDIAQQIREKVNGLLDRITNLEQSINTLINFVPILLISTLSTNLLSLIILLCLICTWCSIKSIGNQKKKRKQRQSPVTAAMRAAAADDEGLYSQPIYVGGTSSRNQRRPSAAQHPFRNIELDEMDLRNSLRTQM